MPRSSSSPAVRVALAQCALLLALGSAGCRSPADPIAASLIELGVASSWGAGWSLDGAAHHAPGLTETRLRKGDEILRIRSQDAAPADIEQLVADQRYLIESLFADHRVPYSGHISETTRCPEPLLPRDRTAGAPGGLKLLMTLPANERFGFGGCSEDLLAYDAAVALLPCGERLLRIESFVPRGADAQAPARRVTSVSCAGPDQRAR